LRQGRLMLPERFAQAAAPYVFGLVIDGVGAGALWRSAALGGFCFVALMLLPGPSTNKQATAGR